MARQEKTRTKKEGQHHKRDISKQESKHYNHGSLENNQNIMEVSVVLQRAQQKPPYISFAFLVLETLYNVAKEIIERKNAKFDLTYQLSKLKKYQTNKSTNSAIKTKQ